MSGEPRELRPLPAGEWDERLNGIVSDMGGRPLNVHGLMAHHPDLLQAWWPYRNHVVGGGSLGRRRAELVILRVASRLRVSYQWESHVRRGLDAGLTPAEIDAVRRDPSEEAWAAGDALLLRGVDECLSQGRISMATRRGMEAHFSDRQIMDVIAISGMYTTLGCMIETWSVELDQPVRD